MHLKLNRDGKVTEKGMEAPPLPGKKECGSCTLCCTWLEASELDPPKPAMVRCPHLTRKGCGIYETRPQQCRDFYCVWAAGLWGGINVRPDVTGVLPTIAVEGEQMVLHCHPDHPTAWRRSAVRRMILKTMGPLMQFVVVKAGEKEGIELGTKHHIV